MHANLFMLAMTLSSGYHYHRILPAVDAAVGVASDQDPQPAAAELFPILWKEDPDAARFALARLSVAIMWTESAFDINATNPDTGTCSLMQVSPIHLPGYACDPLKRSHVLAIRYGVSVLLHHVRGCGGSLRAGLGAYASGRCSLDSPAAARWWRLAGL